MQCHIEKSTNSRTSRLLPKSLKKTNTLGNYSSIITTLSFPYFLLSRKLSQSLNTRNLSKRVIDSKFPKNYFSSLIRHSIPTWYIYFIPSAFVGIMKIFMDNNFVLIICTYSLQSNIRYPIHSWPLEASHTLSCKYIYNFTRRIRSFSNSSFCFLWLPYFSEKFSRLMRTCPIFKLWNFEFLYPVHSFSHVFQSRMHKVRNSILTL